MDWPNANRYNEALQNPMRCFQDPTLKLCRPETNKHGTPKCRSGNFAIVYKMMQGAEPRKAVRVFKARLDERQDHYETLSAHLANHRPTCIIDFRYDKKGVRIGNDWFPMLVMDWVQGLTLGAWVREVLSQPDASARLRSMSERWVELLDELRKHQIAHGDLQHGNIMVREERPVLVDYDGMCVPPLVGQKTSEGGLDAYQHPSRKGQLLSLELDHFSAWVIFLALRGLAADPSLHKRYVDDRKNDNLLFIQEDHTDPARSPLWKELLASKDPEVREWAQGLRKTLPDGPFESIPVFEVDPFAVLRRACAQPVLDWEEIVQSAEDLRLKGRPLPDALQEFVRKGREKLEARRHFRLTLGTNHPGQIVAAWRPVLEDWPACAPLQQRYRDALDQVEALKNLAAACRPIGNGRKLVDTWGGVRKILAGVAQADEYRQLAEVVWGPKIAACDVFLDRVRTGASCRAIVEAWNRVKMAGGHPEADSSAPVAERAQRWVLALERLETPVPALTESSDRALCQIWEQAKLDDCPEAAVHKPRIVSAQQRIKTYQNLKETIGVADQGQGSEEAILQAWDLVTPGYAPSLENRVQHARLRHEVRRLLDMTPIAEVGLADAWDAVVAAGVAPTDPVVVQRCELAVQRRQALKELPPLPSGMPPDKEDEALLRAWKEPLLGSCPEAARYLARVRLARDRTTLWGLVEAALLQQDLEQIKRLASDVLLRGYPPFQRRQAEIIALVRKANILDGLRQLCLSPHREWRTILQRVEAPEAQGIVLPSDLAGLVLVARLHGLPTTDTEASDRAWQRTWDEALLGPCAEAQPLRTRLETAQQRLDLFSLLIAEVERAERGEPVGLETLSRLEELPENYSLPLGTRLRAVRSGVKCRLEMEQVILAHPEGAEREYRLAEVWGRWQSQGRHDPGTMDRGQLALRRREALRLLQAPQLSSTLYDQDRACLRLWGESRLHEVPGLAAEKTRFLAASKRLEAWSRLEQALEALDAEGVRQASAAPELQGYPPRLARKAEIERLCLQAIGLADMRAAHQARDWSEIHRLATSSVLQGVCFPKDLQGVAEEAARRVEVRMRLEQALAVGGMRNIARVGDSIFLKDWPAITPMLPEVTKALQLCRLLDELTALINAGDDRGYLRLWRKAAPRLRSVPEAESFQQAADAADRRLRLKEILEKIRTRIDKGDSQALADPKDLQLVRDHPDRFRDYQDRLASPKRGWFLAHVQPKPGKPAFQLRSGKLTICWGWPDSPLVVSCLVALDPDRPLDAPAQARLAPLIVTRQEHQKAQGETAVVVPSGMAKIHVTIWPLVDLGWVRIPGLPRTIGPITLGSTHVG